MIAVLFVTPLLCVYLRPISGLLHLAPFPASWWLAVAGAATVPLWLEPLKTPTRHPSRSRAST